jgi:nickel superoxide dismutase
VKILITKIPTSVFIFILFVFGQNAHSHCQIPCGIYDDHARYKSMLEDASTVEKATNQIITLSNDIDSKEKSTPIAQNYNQLVRWVNNKESHAEKIISTITNYFLTQRVKPKQKDYSDRLIKHHAVILAAMKVKQKASIKETKALKVAIQNLAVYYPKHEH